MILIQTDEYDYHTYILVDYLKHHKIKYQILNQNVKVEFNNLSQNNNEIDFEISINNKTIKYSTIASFWFRRYSIFFDNMETIKSHILTKYADIKQHFKVETEGVIEFVDYLLENHKNAIGNYSNRNFNKMIGLEIAKKVGFKIPHNYIVTKPNDLNKFRKSNTDIITKAIKNQLHLETESNIYKLYTEKVKSNNMIKLHNRFFPTLFQTQINKKIELRIFYLLGKCYSMAIFSQNDNQTSVDFRRYNRIRPNRFIPYKLPKYIENKIKKFMKIANLNTGSLDIIVTKENEYVFLEVNPVGQFGMVSYPCNYNLETKVAEQLMN